MAILRVKEIRALPEAEAAKKLKELRAELAQEMAKKAIGGAPTKASRIRDLRRTISRVLTVAAERKLKEVR